MNHQCTRFKQTGSLKMFAGSWRIIGFGKVKGDSISRDQLEVECVECGGRQWVDRSEIEKKGRYLVRATTTRSERAT